MQAPNYGQLFQRMVEISSGKTSLEVEQRLMHYAKAESLLEAYHVVRRIGREDAKKIATLLKIIA